MRSKFNPTILLRTLTFRQLANFLSFPVPYFVGTVVK